MTATTTTNKNCYRIEVYQKELPPLPLDHEIMRFLGLDIKWIARAAFYQLRGETLSQGELQQISSEVFSDPIVENAFCQNFDVVQVMSFLANLPSYVAEISYLGGVTDNTASAAEEALSLVLPRRQIRCTSGTLLFIKANKMTQAAAEKLVHEFYANELIEKVSVQTFQAFQQQKRFDYAPSSQEASTRAESGNMYQTYDFNCPASELLELSRKNIWALNKNELLTIKNYFQKQSIQDDRKKRKLPPNPTDVEIEVLAQTWSEHCKHKIFAAEIEYSEAELPTEFKKLGSKKINSLYSSYIKQATRIVQENRKIDWAISVFSDNAGIVRYSDKVDIAIKVETHNSPSALDPYGGALTGIVGVNRDILGVGLAARPIGNTNVLCFAPAHWPTREQANELPRGLLHPKRILTGVHKGIQDGGNKSGIPTINGAIYFDYNYAGKPLVYCGTVGVIPPRSSSGRELWKKYHQKGDRVVLVGGRTGVDGIHGATFSSLNLDEQAPSTAVQIGDPLTQRRVTDFMMEAQKRELFEAVTDNGAGGLSSSVGEMAEKTGGAKIDVALVPTKYPEIRPFELVISESQERMTFAVSPEKLQQFMDLAKSYDVEATDLGAFTGHGLFEILYDGATVAVLDMDFLHHGLPQMKLTAHFKGEQFLSFREEEKTDLLPFGLSRQIEQSLQTLLSSPNIASKEKWVRQYDHEVQAATIVKPFVGHSQAGPGNAAVLALAPHGGHSREAIVVGCGMNPRLSYFDTYLMAQYAVDEAIRNLLAQGAELDKISLVDNFCWPDPISSQANPDGDHKLAQLVRSCEALLDMSLAYGLPYVSGKDSMKNDFIGQLSSGEQVKISVPPTLLVTALGYVSDSKKIVTSDFKKINDHIFMLKVPGQKGDGLKYSEWERYFSRKNYQEKVPHYIDPQKSWALYQRLGQAIQMQLLESCHDISDGGLLCCLAECCFGNDLGATILLDRMASLEDLFSESASRFIVSIREENLNTLREIFDNQHLHYLGQVQKQNLTLKKAERELLTFTIQELKGLWRNL